MTAIFAPPIVLILSGPSLALSFDLTVGTLATERRDHRRLGTLVGIALWLIARPDRSPAPSSHVGACRPCGTKPDYVNLVHQEPAMRTLNIHEAKTHLSRLVDQAAKGEPFVIVKAGRPMVKVVALDAPPKKPIRRLGFLKGQFTIPDDFNRMAEDEIARLFEGGPE
jgi:prevent-host-death family protein